MYNKEIEIESEKAFERDIKGRLLALLEPLLPEVAVTLNLELELELELAIVFFEPLDDRK